MNEILLKTGDVVAYQVFCAIADHKQDLGIVPTFRDLGKMLDISHTTARRKVLILRSLGLVDYEDGKPRTLQIVRMPEFTDIKRHLGMKRQYS